MATDFFEVAQPLDHDTFLSITHEVLQWSLLVLAPFGLPRQVRQAVGSEALFIKKYGPRFRFILEAVSEVVYANRGVSESEVAVTLHKYAEEEQDPEAIAYLGRMSDALRLVYSPPRILELPEVPPIDDLVRAGLSMLRGGAIYAPGPRALSAKGVCSEGVPFGGTTEAKCPCTDEGSSGDRTACGLRHDCAVTLCVACNARQLSAAYARHLESPVEAIVTTDEGETTLGSQEESQEEGRDDIGGNAEAGQRGTNERRDAPDAPTCEYEKAQRVKVASCLSAMTNILQEERFFSKAVEQPHLQALTEAYAAKHSGGSVHGGDARACSMSSDSSPCQELSRRLDVAALDYISAVPFMDNEFFELIRALEQPRLWQGAKEAIDSVVRLPDGKMCKEPDVALECVLTSQAYRTLAEQSVEKGLARLGANYFNDAISQGSDYLPGRYLAELLAGRAKCDLKQGMFEAANARADSALEVHATCGEAFLVRGQSRRELGDNQGALTDLVNAFVLQGSALNGSGDGGAAQAIEDVSREASKAKAEEAFSLREAANTLPADWVVRSFFSSYNREDLYDEYESEARSELLDAQEPLTGEDAFWKGIHLLKEGRFALSMESFSAALYTEDLRLKSLALEHYGSFLYLVGDMDASLEHFRRSTFADATNIKSWVKKGSVLSDLGRRDEAFECFEAAQAIDPLDSDLFLHRGQGHLLANNFRMAAADLQRSVDLHSTMPVAWAAWGVALFKLGTTDGQPSPSSVRTCLRVMEDALARFPDSSEVLLFFAEVVISLGDFSRGLKLLKSSASLDPECPIPYVNAARAYLGMNDLVAARRHLERGQELDATYPGTFMDMGQLLMQESLPAEALSMYTRGVETARFPSELHDAMACLDVAKCHLQAQQLLHRDSML